MNNIKEGLYSSALERVPDVTLLDTERLSQHGRNFHFAMRCNGYFLLENGNWMYSPSATEPFTNEFNGQRVSFFGPEPKDKFFSAAQVGHHRFMPVFEQQPVTEAIQKYREVDEDQAARIAFVLGGIVRHWSHETPYSDALAGKISNAVKFVARMTTLGEQRSGDAVASSMAMYVISGGSLEQDKSLTGNVYYMAEAVRKDPVVVLETEDLGHSQTARLHAFWEKIQEKEPQASVDITELKKDFAGFPTVGAEFHFPLSIASERPNFWQRLSLLNISQYQPGSYIQLSREDQGVIEVRMNPSIYPIAIATWNHMRLLLPELNSAFFTVTINRGLEEGDFSWGNNEDQRLLNDLSSIGMLTYAGVFDENVTPAERTKGPNEIDFGAVYLGQTVRKHDGEYGYTGEWKGGSGQYGQLGIFAGWGENFPYLAYYSSVMLAEPNILSPILKDYLPGIKTLDDALAVSQTDRNGIFNAILNGVRSDERLNKAHDAGNQIMEILNP